AVRPDSSGQAPRVQPGDRITQVEVKEAGKAVTRYVTSRTTPAPAGVTEHDLDPVKLPHQLQAWAARRADAPAEDRAVQLTVLRHDPVTHKETAPVVIEVPWDDHRQHDRAIPLSLSSPLPIAGLNLAYRVENTIDAVQPGS